MNLIQQRIPFLFLVIVATLGLLMRSMIWLDTGIPYTHLMHAHSHVGFQGWIYLMLFVLSTRFFLTNEQRKRGRYALQFNLTVGVLGLMLLAFLWQGYATLSIAFSTLFQILNYWFIIRFWKDLGHVQTHPLVVRFVRFGLLLGVLSTLAPYYVGYLSAIGMKGSALYSAALYFFFHFQYNGWFLFVLFGLFYQWLTKGNRLAINSHDHLFFWTLAGATLLSYPMSILGLGFGESVRTIAYSGGILTFASLLFLPQLFRHLRQIPFHSLSLLLWTFILSFFAKQIFQLISLLPEVEVFAFHNRFAVISFLHWCFLFVLSAGLIGLTYVTQSKGLHKVNRVGILLFGLGAVASETALLVSSMNKFLSPEILWWASLPLFVGALLLIPLKHEHKK